MLEEFYDKGICVIRDVIKKNELAKNMFKEEGKKISIWMKSGAGEIRSWTERISWEV